MLTCAITGHRPTRFKWKYKENHNGCKRLKKRLHDQIVLLYEKGFRRFYVGGAMGVDMWAAEILLRLKEQPEYPDIQLIVALPFRSHDKDWDDWHQKRSRFIQAHAEVVVVWEHPGPEGYKKRNYYMVDYADALLAVYDNDRTIRSGTGMTVNYARKKGLPVICIHPDTGIIKIMDHSGVENRNQM